VIKWREIGYCFTFANHPGSSMDVLTKVVPKWAHVYLEKQQTGGSFGGGFSLTQLDHCSTADATWNAMQTYLRETGELHNNARMTWGKTVLHWQSKGHQAAEILRQICFLNDRYALDGLSPPSYAGILWCFGWGDKPTQSYGISSKWAHSYRTGPDGFERAKASLLDGPGDISSSFGASKRSAGGGQDASQSSSNSSKKARQTTETSSSSPGGKTKENTKSILSFFGPTSTVG
jgi:hypothetical protein